MNNLDLETICHKVCEISKNVGDWMHTEQQNFSNDAIQSKSFNNLVSYVDKEAEKKFVQQLVSLIPYAGIIGEENIANTQNENLNWIIDPLDGTTNYLHKIPIYCTSVALKYKNQILIGVVYDPNKKECFYAWQNGGAFLNYKQIYVSDTASLNNSLIATGFPYDDFTYTESYLKILKKLMKETRGIRRMGAAALDLAYVANGRFDVFFEYALSPWDVAAGSLIVTEAGGRVTDFEGSTNYIFGEQIIASNSSIHDATKKIINHYLTH